MDEHHDPHGVELSPDDWVHDTHPEMVGPHYHQFHQFSHGDAHDDHHFGAVAHHDTHHEDYWPGAGYKHDSEFHGGAQIATDIGHSYDQLFHDIEHQIGHGVEHAETEVAVPHVSELHPSGPDWHYEPPTDFHHELPVHADHEVIYSHADSHEEVYHPAEHHALDHHTIHLDIVEEADAPTESPAQAQQTPESEPVSSDDKEDEEMPQIAAGKQLYYRGDGFWLQ